MLQPIERGVLLCQVVGVILGVERSADLPEEGTGLAEAGVAVDMGPEPLGDLAQVALGNGTEHIPQILSHDAEHLGSVGAAKGAALMSGTTVTWHQLDGTADTVSNTVLEKLLYENLQEAPLPEYTQQEWDFAETLRKTYPHEGLPGNGVDSNPLLKKEVSKLSDQGQKAINDFVVPYYPSSFYSPGSTDVGDVSWLTPTAQFNAAAWPSQVPGHSWQVVSIGKSGQAHKALKYAAKVLAGAAADLMEKPEILKAAREEFNENAAAGYDCPIGPEVKPSAQ